MSHIEHRLRERLSRRIFGHWSQRVVDDRLARYYALEAETKRLAAMGDWQGVKSALDRYRAS